MGSWRESCYVFPIVFALRRNGGCAIVAGNFAREAAAALLRMAKTTSGQKLAASLVEKAADIQDRLDRSWSIEKGPHSPNVKES